jgi:hypothetical protein
MSLLFVNLITEEALDMKLSKKQEEKLKNLDIIKATQQAREESNRLLNDQGFAVLSDAVITYDSHFLKIKDIISIYTPEEIVSKF